MIDYVSTFNVIFKFSDSNLQIRVKRLIQPSHKNGLTDENVSYHIFHGRTTTTYLDVGFLIPSSLLLE